MEHLRRHERIHDSTRRFPCRHCPKLFTRSDILRRHEVTHAVAAQSNGARTVSARACTECAKSRERCSKSSPCQRCMNKNLPCAYPQLQVARRPQGVRFDQNSQMSLSQTAHYHSSVGASGWSSDSRIDRHSQQATNAGVPDTYTSFQHMVQFEEQEYSEVHPLQSTMEFPMNWLPPDNSLAIDYDNIVGLGIGSADFLSLSDPTTDFTAIQNVHQEPITNNQAQRHHQLSAPAWRDGVILTGNSGMTGNDTSPGTVESYVSSESPHSAAHSVSLNNAPGGLYATSINGARMPCTVRARRATRPIRGARPIRPLSEIQIQSRSEDRGLDFPDVSHIVVDDATIPSSEGSTDVALSISENTYDTITQSFTKHCLSDGSSFPGYSTSTFPSLSSLNFCVRHYFENFDRIVPFLHCAVVCINDHWLLALAVAAIGCQYVEADEYSQMAEPLHELLRRAIVVEFTAETLSDVARSRTGLAFAQAMVLSHVGMLYVGSSDLLHFAKAQHSAMIELARVLSVPATEFEFTQSGEQHGNNRQIGSTSWDLAMLNECKRRVICLVRLLDCMGVYHFQQQSLIPPEILAVQLPNDKLWQTTSAADWDLNSAFIPDMPCLSSATVTLFREKQAVPELGQFSRVALLHGVYREIFQLKDCFTRPLRNWIPSIQQRAIQVVVSPTSPPDSESGESLLNSWRNAALDCVDVLHWAANGTIALQAGAEHPTVLHLHLSRVVLLAPFETFQTLADSVVSFAQQGSSTRGSKIASRENVVKAERDILEWAQRDMFKARLAVLHSGCLFWHIRRYSCRAFYEPLAVFLATLTIWAYSSYASRTAGSFKQFPTGGQHSDESGSGDRSPRGDGLRDADFPRSPPGDEANEPGPTFIHLDRPNDDEMVQAFVRYGTPTFMTANISGVGDIYSNEGPARILKEGRKILATVSTAWGRTKRFTSVLEILEQVSSGRKTLDTGRS